jgi:serine/threonine-protein kinase RsbW
MQTARHSISAEARSVPCSRTFPGTADQTGQARRFLAAILGGSPLTDDAVTCLGELANNSVVHSKSRRPGGTFTVRAVTSPGRLRVEVEDQGGPWEPRPARTGPDAPSGRGLLIVAALADAWDISPKTTCTRRVAWFLMRLPVKQP